MNIYKIIRITAAVASLALYPVISTAQTLDNEMGGAFQLAISDSRVANVAYVAYDISSAFDSSPDGLASAGSNSVFMAISFGNLFTFATDELVGLRTNTDSLAEGFTEAFAVATEEVVSSGGSASSLASSLSEVFASFPDDSASLVSSASAQAGGLSETLAISSDELLSVDSTTTTLGAGLSDSIVVSGDGMTTFTTASSVTSTDSDAFVFSADNMASTGVSEGTALALSLIDALAFPTDELTILGENTISVGHSSTDTLAVSTDELLTSNSSAISWATSLKEILVASVDTLVSSNSDATSLGVGFNDTFAVLTDQHRLIAGSNAGFLSTSTSESFADIATSSDIFGAASGVEALAFGYTEAWIETIPNRFRAASTQQIPEPSSLSLVAFGMFCIALVSLRKSFSAQNAPSCT